MLYVSECWPIMKAITNLMEVVELRMLRCTFGKTMLYMVPNGVYRADSEVETIINKMRKEQLRWFGHVKRGPHSTPVRRVEAWRCKILELFKEYEIGDLNEGVIEEEEEVAKVEELGVDYFDQFPTRDELTYHKYLLRDPSPPSLRDPQLS
nr:ataxia telangiectasia mutated family protein [Tanacetum cinerariifolium]